MDRESSSYAAYPVLRQLLYRIFPRSISVAPKAVVAAYFWTSLALCCCLAAAAECFDLSHAPFADDRAVRIPGMARRIEYRL